MRWHLGPLTSFDTETSGLNVETDRIVTAAVLGIRPQRGSNPEDDPTRWLAIDRLGWMSDAGGMDIPEAASNIHGITTEVARTQGWPAAKVISGVAIALAERIAVGVPVVVMNAPYDLTLLDRELQRYGLPQLAEQAGQELIVIDPLVLDRHVDRYRRGRRTLTALCELYDVQLDGAHEAAADALAAARVAVAIADRYPAIAEMPLPELHKAQQTWAGEQAVSLQEYLRKTALDATVSPEWPLIPRQGGTQ